MKILPEFVAEETQDEKRQFKVILTVVVKERLEVHDKEKNTLKIRILQIKIKTELYRLIRCLISLLPFSDSDFKHKV